jgi:MOSC domain-containing protein YiiM
LAQLLSVNVGVPRNIPGTNTLTGIYKLPVEGPLAITSDGIATDIIADRRHHGGADQAIYVYFQEDYAFWESQGVATEPGLFGENFTLSGMDSLTCAIGDRFTIGALVLEVSYYRKPCRTFSARMGNPAWLKRFQKARRAGAYCRVITPGTVEAGMDVTITPYAGARVTLAEIMGYDGVATIPDDFMQRALTTPLRDKTREKYETNLNRLF